MDANFVGPFAVGVMAAVPLVLLAQVLGDFVGSWWRDRRATADLAALGQQLERHNALRDRAAKAEAENGELRAQLALLKLDLRDVPAGGIPQ